MVHYGASLFSNSQSVLLWHPSMVNKRRFRHSEPRIQCKHEKGVLGPRSPSSSANNNNNPCTQFFQHIASLPLPPLKLNANRVMNPATTAKIFATILVLVVVNFLVKSGKRSGGSVEDLVKRGQLRSHMNFKSQPLKYDDPFNNPIVKMRGENLVMRMCGKIFKLQPVTLTQEKMLSHQTRRVHAYQWKRPSIFLIEGEPVPDGVDPETIRWIPPNHPFATAEAEIDEASAEMNVYQTRGVPSRVRAEHEALRKKMMRHSHLTVHAAANEQSRGRKTAANEQSRGRKIGFKDGLDDEGSASEPSSRKEDDAMEGSMESSFPPLHGRLLNKSTDQTW